MQQLIASFILLVYLITFLGCENGGNVNTETIGQFIDKPVSGLDYACSSGTIGMTNSSGEYICGYGDNVTFSINGIILGTVSAQNSITTPYMLFPNNKTAALNVARLLQSIDTSANDESIIIDANLASLIPATTNFNLTTATFQKEIEKALGITLVSLEDAETSMNEAIVLAGENIPKNLNNAPIADAGTDQTVTTGALVKLDGNDSSDIDGDSLIYIWSIILKPEGSSPILSNSLVVSPTFSADMDGEYTMSLIVNDGIIISEASLINIKALGVEDNSTEQNTSTVVVINERPIADAGFDRNVTTGSLVVLDGSGSSDSDGDSLSYLWSVESQPTDSNVTLSSSVSISPTLSTEIDGNYTFNLIVDDGNLSSITDKVNIVSYTPNTVPISDAGLDQNVTTSFLATLDGSGSYDENNDSLTYEWNIVSSPSGSAAVLSDSTTAYPTFMADLYGTYIIGLVVNDGKDSSIESTVTISTPDTFTTVWETNVTKTSITIPVNPNYTYDYIVDWGDGTIDKQKDADATHIYTTNGEHTVNIYGTFPAIYFNNTGDKNQIKRILNWGDIEWLDMNASFYGCKNLKLNASDSPNLSKVSSLQNMFYGNSSLNPSALYWDVSNITNMQGLFYGATLFNTNINSWNVSKVKDMSYMFYDATSFNNPLNSWNVLNVENMGWMFYRASSFNQALSNWDVSKVTDMQWMFFNASSFNQNIDSWNVGNVNDMKYMFSYASTFNQPLLNWNVSNVIDMEVMFYGASSFNYSIDNWDVSKVTDMKYMFYNASAFNKTLNSWDVSNVTDMKYMFYGASSFNQTLSSWDVDNVRDMQYMFYNASKFDESIYAWNVSNVLNMTNMFNGALDFNQNISSWDVSSVKDMSYMFQGAEKFNQNLSTWNVSNVLNMTNMFKGAENFNSDSNSLFTASVSKVLDMSHMFHGASDFNAPINHWNVLEVTDMNHMFYGAEKFNTSLFNIPIDANVTNMNHMFYGASVFNQDINTWNVSKVRDMNHMFYGASDFNKSLSNWNVSNVTDMNHMFYEAEKFNIAIFNITDANVTDMNHMFYGASEFNQNINTWIVSKVKDMNHMFYNNSKFNKELNNWNVSSVTDMSYMFYGASVFNQALSWNVSSVRDMSYMFYGASVFNDDISSWNVANVTNMSHMFYEASAFNQPSVANWNLLSVVDMSYMFYNATVFNQPLSNWDVDNVTNMKWMFYKATAFHQDIGSWDVAKVTNMERMFLFASSFNYSLSSWDVSNVVYMGGMFSFAASLNNQSFTEWDVEGVIDHIDFIKDTGPGNSEPIW